MWTLVGGGLKSLSQSGRPMASVLPKEAEWLKTKAVTFDPDKNTVTTEDGTKVQYEYAVIAMGIQVSFKASHISNLLLFANVMTVKHRTVF